MILLALHGWPPEAMGGAGLYVRGLARALRARGREVAVIAAAPGPSAAVERRVSDDGIPGWILLAPPLTRWEQTWEQPARAALLPGLLDRLRPRVLHVHHLSGLPWSLVLAARERGARTVLTLHDYALPCARGQLVNRERKLCPGPSPERCARCLSDQLGLNPATAAAGRLLERAPRLRRLARRALGALPRGEAAEARMRSRNMALQDVLSSCDVVLSPSDDLAGRFQAMGLGRPRRCELPLLGPVPVAGDPGEGPLRLLFASALIPTKGPERLLSAFARLPPGAATLTLAGPAPAFDGDPGFADRLVGRARATPGVRVLGEVAPERMGALLAEHDVLVLPSLWPENSPLVVREATAAGLRVIVSEQGGAAELAPAARQVSNELDNLADLEQALQQEIQRGRGRVPAARWPTPDEHADWLIQEVYRL